MNIAGVDLGGRKIAISFFDDGKMISALEYETKKSTRARELWDLADWSRNLLRLADLVVVEEPLVGRGVRSSLQLAQTAGAVLSTIGDTATHTRSQFVEVATWKKDLLGKGNATKDQVRIWLEEHYPAYAVLCGDSQDKVDATCIGLYGVRLHARSQELGVL